MIDYLVGWLINWLIDEIKQSLNKHEQGRVKLTDLYRNLTNFRYFIWFVINLQDMLSFDISTHMFMSIVVCCLWTLTLQ